jgi:uncharacterized protein DUF4070
MSYMLLVNSMWTQGIRSSYRRAYWSFLWRMVRTHRHDATKIWMGSMILLAAHHFLLYTREVASELARAIESVAESRCRTSPSSRERVPSGDDHGGAAEPARAG